MKLDININVHVHNASQDERIMKSLAHLIQLGDSIMQAIKDFAAAQAAFNETSGAALDAIVASTRSIADDVKNLNDQIAALQNSAGTISAEDQETLNALQAAGAALAEKTSGVAAALKALDDLTPPAVPATPSA